MNGVITVEHYIDYREGGCSHVLIKAYCRRCHCDIGNASETCSYRETCEWIAISVEL